MENKIRHKGNLYLQRYVTESRRTAKCGGFLQRFYQLAMASANMRKTPMMHLCINKAKISRCIGCSKDVLLTLDKYCDVPLFQPNCKIMQNGGTKMKRLLSTFLAAVLLISMMSGFALAKEAPAMEDQLSGALYQGRDVILTNLSILPESG